MKPRGMAAALAQLGAWSRRWRRLRLRASALGLGALMVVGATLPASAGIASAAAGSGETPQVQLANQYGPLGSITVQQSVYGSVYGGSGGVTILPAPASYPTPPTDFVSQLQSLGQAAMNMEKANPLLNQSVVSQQAQNLQSLIANLTPQELGMAYGALQQTGGWQTWAGKMNAAATQLANEPAALLATVSPSSVTTVAGPTVSTTAAGPTAPQSPAAQAVTVLGPPPGGFSPPQAPPDTCPSPAPGGDVAIAALDLTSSAMSEVRNLVPELLTIGAEVLGEGTTFTIPDPVWDVFELIEAAVEITGKTFAVIQAAYSSCEGDAHSQLLVDLYNNLATTQQELLGQTTTTLNDVITLQAVENSRSTTILNVLATLNKKFNTQIGTVLSSQNALTQLLNNLTISQQAAQRSNVDYQHLQLQLNIEQNLSAGGGNLATFELPVSAGGYLNSTPVGVQEVVTQTVTDMRQANEPIDPDALQDLSNANQALAAGQYKLAYAEYKAAYQTLTAVTLPTQIQEPPGQSATGVN